jgi:hypothetical protein
LVSLVGQLQTGTRKVGQADGQKDRQMKANSVLAPVLAATCI